MDKLIENTKHYEVLPVNSKNGLVLWFVFEFTDQYENEKYAPLVIAFSYGFRTKKSCQEYLECVVQEIKNIDNII